MSPGTCVTCAHWQGSNDHPVCEDCRLRWNKPNWAPIGGVQPLLDEIQRLKRRVAELVRVTGGER